MASPDIETAERRDFVREIVAADLRDGRAHRRRHPVPAGAQRLSPHRPRQVDLPELRHRRRVRRPLPPPVRRHEPAQGGAGVPRRDPGRRALARLRLGRAPVPRLRLLRAAVRLGGPPHPQRRRLCRRPVRRRDPRLPRHADRAWSREPVARPADRGEPRPVRPDARRRVPGRRPRPARADRHGLAEHHPARPRPVPDPPRHPSAHRRRLVHLPDLRLRPRPVRRHRGRDPLDLHARVREPSPALRLAHRAPAGPVAAAPDTSSPGST